MDGSKRSSKSNAFLLGFGRNKRIALVDTLIKNHTVPELVAVLAHEIGHHKKKHILQGTIINIVHFGVLFFILSIFLGSPGLYDAFYMQQQSVYSGILFVALLYTPLEMIISVLTHTLSRKNECEADRFAADNIEHPQHLIEALKKLYAGHLSNLTPHPFYVLLNDSHPPLLQRIRAILRYEA
jgi:STE24 endopeptidase